MSAACGETVLFSFLGVFSVFFLFKRGGEGREKMTSTQEDQLGSRPGASQ